MGSTEKQLLLLYSELESELHDQILPFWKEKMVDFSTGGFYGRALYDETIVSEAPRGSVLNARILWTFSAAYNATGREEYLEFARYAYEYFVAHFVDKEHGGIFWSLHANGTVCNDRKQIYAQAFTIYALSEYYKASEVSESLLLAIDLYTLVEKYAADNKHNGYVEALSAAWQELEDQRLSEKDANEPKSMNTHLHLLEAYTNLFLVWKDKELKIRLQNLLQLHLDKILNTRTGHFRLFFDMEWNVKSAHYSYGHDIEGAWLMRRAAMVLDNQVLINAVNLKVLFMARVILAEGISGNDGSLLNEGSNGVVTDTHRHWWPQAEAIIGFCDAWDIGRDAAFIEAAVDTWNFVKSYLRHPSGEWWWLVDETYQPDKSQDLAGEWKCPYHNSRLCIELLKRVPQWMDVTPFTQSTQPAKY